MFHLFIVIFTCTVKVIVYNQSRFDCSIDVTFRSAVLLTTIAVPMEQNEAVEFWHSSILCARSHQYMQSFATTHSYAIVSAVNVAMNASLGYNAQIHNLLFHDLARTYGFSVRVCGLPLIELCTRKRVTVIAVRWPVANLSDATVPSGPYLTE